MGITELGFVVWLGDVSISLFTHLWVFWFAMSGCIQMEGPTEIKLNWYVTHYIAPICKLWVLGLIEAFCRLEMVMWYGKFETTNDNLNVKAMPNTPYVIQKLWKRYWDVTRISRKVIFFCSWLYGKLINVNLNMVGHKKNNWTNQ